LIEVILYAPAGRPFVTFAVKTPFTAAAFKPRKNANVVGFVGVVCVREDNASMTMWEWPMMRPCAFSCWGAEK